MLTILNSGDRVSGLTGNRVAGEPRTGRASWRFWRNVSDAFSEHPVGSFLETPIFSAERFRIFTWRNAHV